MRTSTSRLRRVVAGLAAAAIPLTILATGPSAHAANPNGSVYELFFETNVTGNPVNTILSGNAADQRALSADLTGGDASFLSAFQITDGDFSKLAIAIVPTSANGSAERPVVTAGEKLGEAYPYWIGGTPFSGMGAPNGDEVYTQSRFNAWVLDGKPDQIFRSSDLVMIDSLRPGNPVSVAPRATSMLNTWAAGTDLSMVLVRITGLSANGEPLMYAGSDGRAVSAWIPFATGQDPARPVATSGLWQVAAAPAAATTTTLAATPASPRQSGTPVTLNASVSPAAAGSIQFRDGATAFATVPVNASGAASTTTSALSVGGHSLTASFVPDNPAAFAPSSSASISYNITGIPAAATTTALAVPATATAGNTVTFTATVAPAAAAGTVQFKRGSTNLGAPVPTDASGVATYNWTATAGSSSISAQFIPANPANYAPSASSPQAIEVAGGTNVNVDPQTIETEVPAGTILIETPYTPTNPLRLGPMALNGANSAYTVSGGFSSIKVTDTRAGARAWTATVLADNLTSGPANVINGQNVGLTGLTQVSHNGLGTITATPVPAAAAVAAGDGGILGLGGTAKTILASTAGPGTTEYSGTLTVNAPTSTKAGIYTGTVTFTVIGS